MNLVPQNDAWLWYQLCSKIQVALSNGTILDSNFSGQAAPLKLTLGKQAVLPGIEKGVLGMCERWAQIRCMTLYD